MTDWIELWLDYLDSHGLLPGLATPETAARADEISRARVGKAYPIVDLDYRTVKDLRLAIKAARLC